jgi:hypothetical protein
MKYECNFCCKKFSSKKNLLSHQTGYNECTFIQREKELISQKEKEIEKERELLYQKEKELISQKEKEIEKERELLYQKEKELRYQMKLTIEQNMEREKEFNQIKIDHLNETIEKSNETIEFLKNKVEYLTQQLIDKPTVIDKSTNVQVVQLTYEDYFKTKTGIAANRSNIVQDKKGLQKLEDWIYNLQHTNFTNYNYLTLLEKVFGRNIITDNCIITDTHRGNLKIKWFNNIEDWTSARVPWSIESDMSGINNLVKDLTEHPKKKHIKNNEHHLNNLRLSILKKHKGKLGWKDLKGQSCLSVKQNHKSVL